jgi:phosphoribosylglycinamide formyltransferase-1
LVLAGYMELLGSALLARFPRGVINVHPSLLPAFPGLDPVGQALTYGVKVFGVTVHYVDDGVDTGPVILQGAVTLEAPRSVEEVMVHLRPVEHDLLPRVVRLAAEGRLHREAGHPRRVRVVERAG